MQYTFIARDGAPPLEELWDTHNIRGIQLGAQLGRCCWYAGIQDEVGRPISRDPLQWCWCSASKWHFRVQYRQHHVLYGSHYDAARHSTVRWPNIADSSLWPMAVDYAVHVFNHVPNAVSGISPIELVTRLAQPNKDFKHLHVWGSPTYVLDPTLQSGRNFQSGNHVPDVLSLSVCPRNTPGRSL
jgi:hypothetical protein